MSQQLDPSQTLLGHRTIETEMSTQNDRAFSPWTIRRNVLNSRMDNKTSMKIRPKMNSLEIPKIRPYTRYEEDRRKDEAKSTQLDEIKEKPYGIQLDQIKIDKKRVLVIKPKNEKINRPKLMQLDFNWQSKKKFIYNPEKMSKYSTIQEKPLRLSMPNRRLRHKQQKFFNQNQLKRIQEMYKNNLKMHVLTFQGLHKDIARKEIPILRNTRLDRTSRSWKSPKNGNSPQIMCYGDTINTSTAQHHYSNRQKLKKLASKITKDQDFHIFLDSFAFKSKQ